MKATIKGNIDPRELPGDEKWALIESFAKSLDVPVVRKKKIPEPNLWHDHELYPIALAENSLTQLMIWPLWNLLNKLAALLGIYLNPSNAQRVLHLIATPRVSQVDQSIYDPNKVFTMSELKQLDKVLNDFGFDVKQAKTTTHAIGFYSIMFALLSYLGEEDERIYLSAPEKGDKWELPDDFVGEFGLVDQHQIRLSNQQKERLWFAEEAVASHLNEQEERIRQKVRQTVLSALHDHLPPIQLAENLMNQFGTFSYDLRRIAVTETVHAFNDITIMSVPEGMFMIGHTMQDERVCDYCLNNIEGVILKVSHTPGDEDEEIWPGKRYDMNSSQRDRWAYGPSQSHVNCRCWWELFLP